MDGQFLNITLDNIDEEHLCCAISDKKHAAGLDVKKQWMKERLCEGHVFRKLDEKGKIFIEYAPLEKAWVPVVGDNYQYVYCLWVAGSFKGKGYAKALMDYCINDARTQGKSGICMISSKKKKPYLSDKKFLEKFGFETVDVIQGDYELMALSFDGTKPAFLDTAKQMRIDQNELTIYYGKQCPFILTNFCEANHIPLTLHPVDTLEKAKAVPGIFNNWTVFYKGECIGVQLMNENILKKLLQR